MAHGDAGRAMAKFLREKSQTEVHFLEITEFSFNTAQDSTREAPEPKASGISSAVLTQYRRVTDRHTQTDS